MMLPTQHYQVESMNETSGTHKIHEVTLLRAQRQKARKENNEEKPEHKIMQLITQH